MPSPLYARINEDGSFSVLARITALQALGTEVAPGEGNCVQQADVDSITCKVFNLGSNKNNPAGTEVTPAPTLSANDNILDELEITGWPHDAYGYNFVHHMSPTYPSSPNTYYRVEYKINVTGNIPIWLKIVVYTDPVQSS